MLVSFAPTRRTTHTYPVELLDGIDGAFYWAITVLSTVGFGDITPKTWEEKLFAIIAELFGCMLFATLIGGLGGIFGASPLSAPFRLLPTAPP